MLEIAKVECQDIKTHRHLQYAWIIYRHFKIAIKVHKFKFNV